MGKKITCSHNCFRTFLTDSVFFCHLLAVLPKIHHWSRFQLDSVLWLGRKALCHTLECHDLVRSSSMFLKVFTRGAQSLFGLKLEAYFVLIT